MGQRADGEPEEHEGVIVPCSSVEVDFLAAQAAMDEDPFTVAANGDSDRFHGGSAFGSTVPWDAVIDVAAPQAARAVVAVIGAGRVE